MREIANRVAALRALHRARDRRAEEVRAVRHGDFDAVAPGLFSDEWPRSIVANRIETIARHAAAALSPLPTFSCSSPNAKSDSARAFADKRTKIANYYVKRSRLQAQMQAGADQFYTYGVLVTSIEPDLEAKFPSIVIEDSIGIYPVWDRLGRTVEVAHVFRKRAVELMAQYPELADRIRSGLRLQHVGTDHPVEVVKYVSGDRIVMYLAEAPDVVLVDVPNRLGRCTYVVTKRPGLDDEIRGAFDDLIWVQLALHAMQVYTLRGAAEAVNAPIVVPTDVTEVTIGAGEVIRSMNPEQIRRVGLDVPAGAWAAAESLKDELEYGAITPEALGGSIDASVVTGKGVQQLMAGYSQQIAMAQESLVWHFVQVLELCFAMDEAYWPNERKAIEGHADGTPYRIEYVPSRDINGDHSINVQYGGVAGLDPNRGLVFLLQAQGAGLVSNDYVRRHLPSDINPGEEESKIEVEQLRGSLVQSLAAYAQSLPLVVQNGQDPSEVVVKIARAIKERQKGKPLEDIVEQLWPPPEPEPAAAGGGLEEQLAALAGGAGGEDGLSPAGLPPGLRPNMATEGPGARPPLEMFFAGLTASGQPNIQAGVSRMTPARTL